MNSQAQLSQHLAQGAGAGLTRPDAAKGPSGDEEDVPELEAPEEEGEVDETGVDPKDIELVMQQVRIVALNTISGLTFILFR